MGQQNEGQEGKLSGSNAAGSWGAKDYGQYGQYRQDEQYGQTSSAGQDGSGEGILLLVIEMKELPTSLLSLRPD